MKPELDRDNERGTIYIQRKWQFPYGGRSFRVYIDREQVGRIRNGSEERYQVSPGLHTIQIKIDFYRSRSLEVNVLPNQIINLRCGQNISNLFKLLVLEEDIPTIESTITSSFFSIISSFFTIIITVFLLYFLFFTQRFIRRSNGMAPTIRMGDTVIANTFFNNYFIPSREDIVVIKIKQSDRKEINVIQRIIGLPGEQITIKDNTIYIDGKLFEREYLNGTFDRQLNYSLYIPSNSYFVLGDNLSESQDNSLEIGTIHRKQIKGKVIVVYKPFKRFYLVD
ncbi:MAG: signal peptidase I [Prochloraceae cyanobacterium]|nr:signal peptidase I [Prochloraceae cyanobacterium]